MNYSYIFLLLLVVLSAQFESPQYAKPPTIEAIVYPNSSFSQLGILAPVRPHNEVYKTPPPHHEVYKTIPPHIEVSKIILPHNEVSKTTLPQNEVYKITLPQNKAKLNKTVLPQTGVFKIDAVNCQISDSVKMIMNFLLNLQVKSFNNLSSALIHSGEILVWTVRILLESLQHVLKMYTWSLFENQASVQFRCRIVGLFLKQSLFRKHDFDIAVYRLYCNHQNGCFQHLGSVSKYRNDSHAPITEEYTEKSTRCQFHGGGKALLFSSDELLPYSSTDLHEQQYQFRHGVKKIQNESLVLDDGDVLCNVPLKILAPKLTLKVAKELANLHDMYMPSKILLKNAQILLVNHKCETCGNISAVFRPYKVVSNAEHQQTWYSKNKQKRAEYNKHRYSKSDKQLSQKQYWSKKDVKFPPDPPSAELCQNIVSDFCADTSPDVFEEAGCAVCGKLTPICEMEQLSEVENFNLLRVHGITRKARSISSDPVKELRGPILAPGCSNVCSVCMESLEKEKMPVFALANGLWVGEIPDELQNLTYAEQLLIARVRHNRCIVKVSSGMYKMCANAISFSNPMPKIYNVLPPSIEEMDEVLAFIYTGPCKPTKADFQRTPLLVRRLKVSKALHWLKLNHIDYYDCEISDKNLASYPEEGPPVVVDYHPSSSNKNPEATSVHDMEDEDGTTEGPCPFIVHGLTGEEFSTKTMKTIKAIALRHLTSEGKILAVGHAETPESIYGNPQLFPSMLPWLFP